MLPNYDLDTIASECKKRTPLRIVQAIADHRRIAAEAIAKIDQEGTVVRTLKGDVIAHPAIRIHAEAVKAETALIKEWASTGTM